MHFEPPQLSTVLDRTKGPLDSETDRSERRERRRTSVRWPVLLFRDSSVETVETVTENLNCAGFFCFSELPVHCGELLSCVLRIPSWEKHSAVGLALLCSIRVLRVERSAMASRLGIACRIENYHCVATGLEF